VNKALLCTTILLLYYRADNIIKSSFYCTPGALKNWIGGNPEIGLSTNYILSKKRRSWTRSVRNNSTITVQLGYRGEIKLKTNLEPIKKKTGVLVEWCKKTVAATNTLI
jgi:hypothetical protein